MTRPSMSLRNTSAPNQVIAGKELRNAAPLKQPPADFASRPAPGAPRSRFTSATGAGSPPASRLPDGQGRAGTWSPPIIRTIPQPSESNEAIVFDRRTHTFVNGNGGADRAAPAVLMPPSNARTETSRVMIPPPGSMDSQIRRVILPPAGPAPPSRMLVNSVNPPANTMSAPPTPRQGFNPQPGQAAPPRPVSLPPAPQTPHSSPQFSSAPRPAAPMPEPARSAAGAMMQRH
jgi:WAS/WASL-interacting protein